MSKIKDRNTYNLIYDWTNMQCAAYTHTTITRSVNNNARASKKYAAAISTENSCLFNYKSDYCLPIFDYDHPFKLLFHLFCHIWWMSEFTDKTWSVGTSLSFPRNTAKFTWIKTYKLLIHTIETLKVMQGHQAHHFLHFKMCNNLTSIGYEVIRPIWSVNQSSIIDLGHGVIQFFVIQWY